jgi:hypothetical protein
MVDDTVVGERRHDSSNRPPASDRDGRPDPALLLQALLPAASNGQLEQMVRTLPARFVTVIALLWLNTLHVNEHADELLLLCCFVDWCGGGKAHSFRREGGLLVSRVLLLSSLSCDF